MLYVIDHYFAINHQDYCSIVEMDQGVNEVVNITSTIPLLFEIKVEEGKLIDMNWLVDILTTYYGAKSVKNEFSERDLLSLNMPIESIYEEVILAHDNQPTKQLFVIDLYEAMDSYCGMK